MKLSSAHITNGRSALGYHQKPLPFFFFFFAFLIPPCSWLRIIWKFTVFSSILMRPFLSHKTPGLDIHSFCTMCQALGTQIQRRGTVSVPREPSRGGAHVPRILRAPTVCATLPVSPPAQGSCLLSDTVSTSSPSGAHEMQPLWLVPSQNFTQSARLKVCRLKAPQSKSSSSSGRESTYKVSLASSGLVFYWVKRPN